MAAAQLIKIDRNGSKHYEGLITCDRCGGTGTYVWGAIINGVPQYAGECYKCEGAGKIHRKWIERTPEYQAKLDARRQAKLEAQWKAAEEENAARMEQIRLAQELEQQRKEAEERRIKAQKAISQFVGTVGEKITAIGCFDHTAWFEVDSFRGYGKETMYIHTFKDPDGNVLIWKTSNGLGNLDLHYGEPVEIKGTVKEHTVYDDQKQTVLTRCKITRKDG